MNRVIPSDYQHMVFGLPGRFRPLAAVNRKAISKLMFGSINQTIREFCKEKENYVTGLVGVFHSFNKSLGIHYHFHIIRNAGGISLDDGKTWVDGTYINEKFVKERWKAKFMEGLRKLYEKEELKGYYGTLNKQAFNQFLDSVFKQDWYVWIDQAEKGNTLIPYFYITRYLKRMPITAKRIVSYSKAAKIVKWLPQSRQPLAKTQAFTTPACMPRLTEKPITRLLKNILIN